MNLGQLVDAWAAVGNGFCNAEVHTEADIQCFLSEAFRCIGKRVYANSHFGEPRSGNGTSDPGTTNDRKPDLVVIESEGDWWPPHRCQNSTAPPPMAGTVSAIIEAKHRLSLALPKAEIDKDVVSLVHYKSNVGGSVRLDTYKPCTAFFSSRVPNHAIKGRGFPPVAKSAPDRWERQMPRFRIPQGVYLCLAYIVLCWDARTTSRRNLVSAYPALNIPNFVYLVGVHNPFGMTEFRVETADEVRVTAQCNQYCTQRCP